MQHGKVSRAMFPEFAIDSITNGVHAPTWVCEPVQQMLDAHIPAWRRDNLYLRNAIDLPEKEILNAHAAPRRRCWPRWPRVPAQVLNPSVLTLGFARRAATYKRANLLFTEPRAAAEDRHRRRAGLQILYAGKAHPQDEPGKALIHQVIEAGAQAFQRPVAHCLP